MDDAKIKEVIKKMFSSGDLQISISGEGNIEHDHGESSSYINLNLSIDIDGETVQSHNESILLS